ncbi:MAG: ribbon-helix-helix protein, CopG family [Deltaproteobacteria bacterium]|nr:ribbon-helix-helix protein, CopG family [Deltaproteobacteria bacterium]
MIRIQVQLEEEVAARLRGAAKREGTSVAELVRRATDRMLEADRSVSVSDRKARALAVCGRFGSGGADGSERHDDYLGEAFGR